jgi:transcriptional regulator with XRE-family HTH domain
MDVRVKNAVSDRLKELRKSAIPTLSIRKMAEELGIGHSRYAYFEDPRRFKKAALPIEFTRQIADVLQRYNVDPAEVMKLAGLSDTEVEPEARNIEAGLPQAHYISLPILLPSEAALTDMFETMLALIPEGASRAEAAQILAQRLPAGFAAIGPILPAQAAFLAPVSGAASRVAATDRPELERQ